MRSGVTLSQICSGDSFISSSGDRFHVLYSAVIEDGSLRLLESGKEDISLLINSYRDQTDMSFIIARLTAGDSSVLNQRAPMYGDFSLCSYDHAEMLRNVMDAHNYFDHLPAATRSRFDDDFVKWFSSAGSRDWSEKMTSVSISNSYEEVNPNES